MILREKIRKGGWTHIDAFSFSVSQKGVVPLLVKMYLCYVRIRRRRHMEKEKKAGLLLLRLLFGLLYVWGGVSCKTVLYRTPQTGEVTLLANTN